MDYESKLAWAAGYFEGEGYIYTRPTGNRVEVGVETTDLDAIQRFRETFGFGNITTRQRGDHKRSYRWLVSNASDSRVALLALLPFLMKRRQDRAILALKTLQGNRNYVR